MIYTKVNRTPLYPQHSKVAMNSKQTSRLNQMMSDVLPLYFFSTGIFSCSSLSWLLPYLLLPYLLELGSEQEERVHSCGSFLPHFGEG